MPKKKSPPKNSHRVIVPPKKHEVGTPFVILIDGMNFAYRARYAYAKLSCKRVGKRISTSLYYGIPELIKSLLLQNQWRLEKVVVFWDGVADPRRLEIFPGYKAHRLKRRDPKQHKKFLKQVSITRKFLNTMGIPQAYDPNIEGDDMCYLLWKKYSPLNKVIVVSSDGDFQQMVNHDTWACNTRTKAITTVALCGAHNWGLNVNQLVDFKCLVGDDSDDIIGYRGIGPSRAAAFLLRFGSIKAYLDNPKSEYPGLVDKIKLKKIWKRNRLLMDLKYFNSKFLSDVKPKFYKDSSFPEFNLEGYEAFCQKYKLLTFLTASFIKQVKRWNNHA